MNAVLSVVLLFMAVVALQYNAILLFGALVLAAVISTPRAWIYTVGAGIGMFLLRYANFPSWELISIVLIAVAYALMSKVEERREESGEIPPELLAYYMMMGGTRGGAR